MSSMKKKKKFFQKKIYNHLFVSSSKLLSFRAFMFFVLMILKLFYGVNEQLKDAMQ